MSRTGTPAVAAVATRPRPAATMTGSERGPVPSAASPAEVLLTPVMLVSRALICSQGSFGRDLGEGLGEPHALAAPIQPDADVVDHADRRGSERLHHRLDPERPAESGMKRDDDHENPRDPRDRRHPGDHRQAGQPTPGPAWAL